MTFVIYQELSGETHSNKICNSLLFHTKHDWGHEAEEDGQDKLRLNSFVLDLSELKCD
jgi:hypothetical protein